MMQTVEQPAVKLNLYRDVAARVNHLVEQGTFAPGDRLPSVRKLSVQFKVSISTVMEAYRLLEDRGVIEARPQSGYYVRLRVALAPAEPEMSRPADIPTAVNICALSAMLLKETHRRDLIQLGAAIPNPEHLPIDRLNRIMSAVMRRDPTAGVLYDALPGCEPLRVQIARRAITAGCALTPDEIVTTVGSQEAINLCLRAVCQPGDTVAIESPMYYGILQSIELMGLRALEIPTHPRDGISLGALRYALDQTRVKACLVISNYSNPIGSCIPEARKRELVELLTERDIPLIEDDIYGDLTFSETRPTVCKAYDRKGLVMTCSSFSKTLAPGYRVGWVAPGRYQPMVERLKLVTTLAGSTPTQLAVAEFLANGGYDHHLRKIRKIYSRQMALTSQAVEAYFPEGTRMTHPEGGSVLWIEMPPKVDSLEVHRKALAAGMTIAPGPMFSAKGKYGNFIRLNVAFWSDPVERAIVKLGHIVGEMA
jgi:DNA-binding transcriptional MocR family regulator